MSAPIPSVPEAVLRLPEGADWVSALADEVATRAAELAPGRTIVCASGLSPSGPIHLGNLREVMVPHLVCDELRRRGLAAEHILSWDDYDRFRKVPGAIEGIESWNEHIGKPLTSVPAPPGSPHDSWAAHYRAAMEESLRQMGIQLRGISQTQMYTSGAYRDRVLQAMMLRAEIDKVLDQYRTLGRAKAKPGGPKLSEEDAAAAALAEQGSGAADDEDGSGAAGSDYYPYKPYCAVCEKDTTNVTAYDDATTELTYVCQCGHTETYLLSQTFQGKLVWKVDWPMRWAYEGVVFEPSGVDHQSPGSSFVVGGELVPLFGWRQPIGPMYAFVGIKGMAKMSSSRGGVPTPADALGIMEPPLLRWLYARRRPNQAFDVSFGQELQRLYDEWDALSRKVAGDTAQEGEMAAYSRAAATADGMLAMTPQPLPYRMLASVADITGGAEDQMLRIFRTVDADTETLASLEPLRPRLTKAQAWLAGYVPPEERTLVRDVPDQVLLDSLGEREAHWLQLLGDHLDDHWSLDALTSLVYGVPKLAAGMSLTDKPTEQVKRDQKEFFELLYRLLVSDPTGPRLPTLLLSIGAERVRMLTGR